MICLFIFGQAVGLLESLTDVERASWAAVINKFQNATTGWYTAFEWEKQNQKNWPWHPTHAAVETLALLGHSPAYPMVCICILKALMLR